VTETADGIDAGVDEWRRDVELHGAAELYGEQCAERRVELPAITVTVHVAANANFAGGEPGERFGRRIGERQHDRFDGDPPAASDESCGLTPPASGNST